MNSKESTEVAGFKRHNKIGRIALGDQVTWGARNNSEKTAFEFPEKDREISYKEFDNLVNRTANAFLNAGLEKGSRVGFVTDTSVDMLIATHGALKSGLVPVLTNVEQDPETLAYQLESVNAEALVVDDEYYSKVTSSYDDTETEPCVSIEWDGSNNPYPLLQKFYEGQSSQDPNVEIAKDDEAVILFTSGTTSKPKGVSHTHMSFTAMYLNPLIKHEVTKHDVMGQILPIYHIAESTLRATMAVGGTTVLFREYSPETLVSAIEEYGISVFVIMSSMYRQLFEKLDLEERDLSPVRKCVYAMPMEMSLRKRVIETFDAKLQAISGQTEAGVINYFDHDWQLEKEGNYVGKPGPFSDCAILDDDGNILPPGEIGEIAYRGPSVMAGYLDREDENRKIWRNDWHRSQDMGKRDEDGLVLFVDRKKDIIKSGGENVSTTKVETVAGDHPKVQECIITGLPHPDWGEAVTAFVKPVADEQVDADEVIKYCREKLATFEVPKDVIFVDEFPMTSTGKIRKVELSDMHSDHYQ